jgi:hypothetical protein
LQERKPGHRLFDPIRRLAAGRPLGGKHTRDLSGTRAAAKLVDQTPLGNGVQPPPHRARRIRGRERGRGVREDLLREFLRIGVVARSPQKEPIQVAPITSERVFDHGRLHPRQQMYPPSPDDETTLHRCRCT